MTDLIVNNIKRSLDEASEMYHSLVLLTGESGSGKTNVLHKLADDLGTSVININLALSRELLDLTARQRSLRAASILDQIVDKAGSPVLLDNLETRPAPSAARHIQKPFRGGIMERYYRFRQAFIR
jgi:midasin (ATPase involved in ribosome maturation)